MNIFNTFVIIKFTAKEQDEETLPGMGVFLELIWKGSTEEQKKIMIDNLYNELHK